ncbi:MAG: Uma2 family endonuclease, partial [Saprospiraceae bacterium]|nr:Uma2 family endonuclease [Saprospiraceae bacterium]
MITSLDQLSMDGTYTYADYLTWQFEERIELIKGRIFKMSPAPSRKHQRASIVLSSIIFDFLRAGPCEVYSAPFDVRLLDSKKKKKSNKEIYSVVQPDICVICDAEKLDDRGCIGAPDWIIEILSPGNNKKEVDNKFRLYEENGVREYWVVY